MSATLTDRLLQKLWQSPAGQAVLEEDRAEQLENRKRAVETIAAAEKTATAKMSGLLKARDAAKAEYEKAAEAFKKCEAAYRHAIAAVTNLSIETGAVISQAQRALSDSASPLIGVFDAKLQGEWSRLRKVVVHAEPSGKTIPRTGEMIMRTNAAALRSRIVAVNSAREAVRAMKLELLTDDQVTERCQQIWDALPSEDRME